MRPSQRFLWIHSFPRCFRDIFKKRVKERKQKSVARRREMLMSLIVYSHRNNFSQKGKDHFQDLAYPSTHTKISLLYFKRGLEYKTLDVNTDTKGINMQA